MSPQVEPLAMPLLIGNSHKRDSYITKRKQYSEKKKERKKIMMGKMACDLITNNI